MLMITIKANVPAADAQGIKERIAMDIERYGDCKVVSIVSDQKYEQIKMEGEKNSAEISVGRAHYLGRLSHK